MRPSEQIPFPEILVERLAGGAIRLKEQRGILMWVLLGFAIAVNAVVLPLLVAVWSGEIHMRDPNYSRAFTLILALVGLALVWAAFTVWRSRRQKKPATLEVSCWPVCLGQPVSLHLLQQVRSTRRLDDVAAVVTLSEQTGDGSSAASQASGEVYRQTLEPVQLRQGVATSLLIDAKWTLTLPKHLPPSYRWETDELIWRIGFRYLSAGEDVAGCEFGLLVVAPEMVDHFR